MIASADFEIAYSTKPCNYEKPICQPPACFVGSYAPVAKVGDPNGKFYVNSSLLQPCLLYTSPSPRD